MNEISDVELLLAILLLLIIPGLLTYLVPNRQDDGKRMIN
jgi:uncharacterized protein YjeT (DUF2065 family)